MFSISLIQLYPLKFLVPFPFGTQHLDEKRVIQTDHGPCRIDLNDGCSFSVRDLSIKLIETVCVLYIFLLKQGGFYSQIPLTFHYQSIRVAVIPLLYSVKEKVYFQDICKREFRWMTNFPRTRTLVPTFKFI